MVTIASDIRKRSTSLYQSITNYNKMNFEQAFAYLAMVGAPNEDPNNLGFKPLVAGDLGVKIEVPLSNSFSSLKDTRRKPKKAVTHESLLPAKSKQRRRYRKEKSLTEEEVWSTLPYNTSCMEEELPKKTTRPFPSSVTPLEIGSRPFGTLECELPEPEDISMVGTVCVSYTGCVTKGSILGFYGEDLPIRIDGTISPPQKNVHYQKLYGLADKPRAGPMSLTEDRYIELMSTPLYLEKPTSKRSLVKVGKQRKSIRTRHREWLLSKEIDQLEMLEMYSDLCGDSKIIKDYYANDLFFYSYALHYNAARFEHEEVSREILGEEDEGGYYWNPCGETFSSDDSTDDEIDPIKDLSVEKQSDLEWDDMELPKSENQFEAGFDLLGFKALGQGLTDVGDGIADAVSDITNLLQAPFKAITKLIKTITPSFSPTSLTQVITTLILLWRNRSSIPDMLLILTNYFSTTGLANTVKFFQPLADLITQHFQAGEATIFSDLEELRGTLTKWFPAGCTVAVCMLLPFLGKSVPTTLSGMLNYFRTKCFSDLGTFMKNLTCVSAGYVFLRSVASSVVNYLMYLTLDVPHPEVLTNIDQLSEFYTRFDNLSKTESVQRCIVENSIVTDIEKLQTDIITWRKDRRTLTPEEMSAYTTVLNKVCALQTRMSTLSSKQAYERTPPLGVLISGESGIGKSTITDYIIRSLAKYHNKLANEKIIEGRIYDDKNLDELKYPLNTDSDYWDGYKNQFAVYVDDFGQRTDSVANPNRQFCETINVVNSATYSLNSAHLEEKGKKFCDSRLYLCTSNHLYYPIKSLTYPEALYRRFEIIANCSIKDEFSIKDGNGKATGVLDKSLCRGLNVDVYEFALYDGRDIAKNNNYQPFVQNLSTKTFLDLLRKCYKEGFEADTQIVRDLKNDDNYVDDIQDQATVDNLFMTHFQNGDDLESALAAGLNVTADDLESDDDFADAPELVPMQTLIAQRVLRETAQQAQKREKVMQIGKILIGIASLIITVYAGKKLYNWITSKKEDCKNCSTWLSSKQDARALSQYIAKSNASCNKCSNIVQKCMTVVEAKQEAAIDEKGYEITKLVQSQQASLHKSATGGRIGIATFIKGRIALMNKHVKQAFLEEEKLYLRFLSHQDPLVVNIKDCSWVDPVDNVTTDYTLCVMPNNVPHKKDIVKHFVSSSELNHFKETQASLTGIVFSDTKHGSGSSKFGKVKALDSTTVGSVTLRDLYEYEIPTEKGECGSILVAQNNKICNKIIGMHAFGGAVTNGSVALTKEKIEKLLADVSASYQISIPKMDSVHETSTVLEHQGVPIPNLPNYGLLKNKPTSATKSQLVKSPLHDKLAEPSTMAVAVLYNPENNPLTMGLKKVANVPAPLDSDQLDRCASHVFQKLTKIDTPYKTKGVLSYAEGIKGDGNLIVPLCRTTSPGYPFVNQRGNTKGKQKWFGSSDYILNEDIEKLIQARVEKAKKGERTETIWIDTLKDERRPMEKVLANKTRVFSVGPMDFIIALRMYFGAFTGAVMENRIDNEICVGVNPYPESNEWRRMYYRLLQNNHTKIIAGDFSNFDGSLLLDVLMKIVDGINEWYDDGAENALVRQVLWQEICQGIHSADGQVYSWTHSQPSGNSMTVIINSIFNSIVMRMSFILSTQRSLMDYDRYVTALNYGDDNLLSFDDEIAEEFNQVTITKALATIGLTYTDEAKTGQLTKYRDISEVAFLKRGFRVSQTEVYAPLSTTTIKEMVQWLRSSADVINDTATHVELALTELSLHDEETFKEISADILRACKENGIPVTGYSYYDMCRNRQFHKFFEANSDEAEIVNTSENTFQGNTEAEDLEVTFVQETNNFTSRLISRLPSCMKLTSKNQTDKAVASQETGDIQFEGNNSEEQAHASQSNLDRAPEYCCEKQCMTIPGDQVDGIACHKCRNYSYCICACIRERVKWNQISMEIRTPVTKKLLRKGIIKAYLHGYNQYVHYDHDTQALYIRNLHDVAVVYTLEKNVKDYLKILINNWDDWMDIGADSGESDLEDYAAMNVSGNPKTAKIIAKKVFESAVSDVSDRTFWFWAIRTALAMEKFFFVGTTNGICLAKWARKTTMIIAPIIEEIVPSNCFEKAIFGLMEFCEKWIGGVPLTYRLPALGLHLTNAFLMSFGFLSTLPLRIVLHSAFNIMTLAYQENYEVEQNIAQITDEIRASEERMMWSNSLPQSKLDTFIDKFPSAKDAAHAYLALSPEDRSNLLDNVSVEANPDGVATSTNVFQSGEDIPLAESVEESVGDIQEGSNLLQMTTSEEVSEKVEAPVQLRDENITSYKQLEREILIQSYTLSSGFKQSFNPMANILTDPAIKPFVSLFQYIRAGVKVTVQVNATKTSQGTGYLYWTPKGYSTPISTAAKTSCIGTYFSYNTGEVATLEMPFINQFKAIGVDGSEFGNFHVDSIVDYIGESCTLNIYATLVNPELFVPAIPATVTSVFQDMFKSFLSKFTDVNHSVFHEQDNSTYKNPLPDHTTMEYLFKDEMMVDVYPWKSTDAVGTTLFDIPVKPDSGSNDMIHFVSQMAQIWRGTMEYVVRPNTHILQSGRVRFGLFPPGVPRTYANINAVPNYIVDLQQDQKHAEVSSVWAVNQFWRDIRSESCYITGFVANSLVDSQNEAGECPILVTRTGKNLKFGYLSNQTLAATTAYDFTSSDDDCKVGQPLSLRDIIETPLMVKAPNPNIAIAAPKAGDLTTPIQALANIYGYCAGSLMTRVYFSPDVSARVQRSYSNNGFAFSNSGPSEGRSMIMRQDTSLNPVMNALVPWVSEAAYAPTHENVKVVSVQANNVEYFAVTAEKDFRFGYKVGTEILVDPGESFTQAELDALQGQYTTGSLFCVVDGPNGWLQTKELQDDNGQYAGTKDNIFVLDPTGKAFTTDKKFVSDDIVGVDILFTNDDSGDTLKASLEEITIDNGKLNIAYYTKDNFFVDGKTYSVLLDDSTGVRRKNNFVR